MTPRTVQPRLPSLRQADAFVMALLSSAILTLGLMLARELWAGGLNRLEMNAVIAAAITLGLVHVWFSLRTVVAIARWAAWRGARLANAPWTLPIWWLGTVPAGWLGLAFPGHEHQPAFLVLALLITARSASALLHVVHAAETHAPG
jgi:hypothetical protein